MKSVQERIRTQILNTQQTDKDYLPAWLRTILRSITGGDSWTAAFLRNIIWKYRWLGLIAVIANAGAGIAEALTIAVFTLAANQVTASMSGQAVEMTGRLNTIFITISNIANGINPIIIFVALAIFFQVLRSALDYTGQAASIYLRTWLEGDLRQRVFKQLMGIRYQQIIENRLGSLTSYSGQVADIGSLVHALGLALNDIMLIVAYVSVLFWISWQFSLVALVLLLAISLSLNNLREKIRMAAAGHLQYTIKTGEQVVEYLQSIRLVHSFVREDYATDQVTQLVNDSIPPLRKSLLSRAMINPIYQSVAIIGVAIILVLGYWVVSTTQFIQIGELIAYLFVLYRIMPRISMLNAQFGTIYSLWPQLFRIAELLNPAGKEMEYQPGKLSINNMQESIELRGVELRYPGGDREVLREISFAIPKGKMIALVGSSGSGKSSIINLLMGLYNPTQGSILIDGIDLQNLDLADWRRLIGVVDQDTIVFSKSIGDNIRFGKPDATDEELRIAARIAKADIFIDPLPAGYDTQIGDRGHKISGGQRQRIAIARAVIGNPSILFFDEATSALDSQTERLIQESMEELRKERTIVVIAHRLSTIAKADQIILLDNGVIHEQGTHQELLARDGRYAAMWKLQANAS